MFSVFLFAVEMCFLAIVWIDTPLLHFFTFWITPFGFCTLRIGMVWDLSFCSLDGWMTDLYTPLMYVGWLGSLDDLDMDDLDMDMDICLMEERP